jgi:hypothetical protein
MVAGSINRKIIKMQACLGISSKPHLKNNQGKKDWGAWLTW